MTVNDYLAKRDAEWNRGVFDRLGITVGAIQNMMPFRERRDAYASDITYGTNSEFGFDYLRDNMAVSHSRVSSSADIFAIVDEVDSILIDEARTPLIISGEPETAAKTYYDFARVVRELERQPATRKTAKGSTRPSCRVPTTSTTRSTRRCRRRRSRSRRSSRRSGSTTSTTRATCSWSTT